MKNSFVKQLGECVRILSVTQFFLFLYILNEEIITTAFHVIDDKMKEKEKVPIII